MSKEFDIRRGPSSSRKNLGPLTRITAFVSLGGATIFSACGGGSDVQDQRTPTGGAGTPTPEAGAIPTAVPTEAPTLVPTPAVTEIPLYGPAPIVEELRDSLKVAFAGNIPLNFERDVNLCLNGNERFNFETINNETDALNLLSACTDLAHDLRTNVSGDQVAVNQGIDILRDAYFAGIGRFVNKGVLSQSYLGTEMVQKTIDLYFSRK